MVGEAGPHKVFFFLILESIVDKTVKNSGPKMKEKHITKGKGWKALLLQGYFAYPRKYPGNEFYFGNPIWLKVVAHIREGLTRGRRKGFWNRQQKLKLRLTPSHAETILLHQGEKRSPLWQGYVPTLTGLCPLEQPGEGVGQISLPQTTCEIGSSIPEIQQ